MLQTLGLAFLSQIQVRILPTDVQNKLFYYTALMHRYYSSARRLVTGSRDAIHVFVHVFGSKFGFRTTDEFTEAL